MMTRKDYISTANILWSFCEVMTNEDHCDIVEEFARMFHVDNPKFDRKKFREACGVYE